MPVVPLRYSKKFFIFFFICEVDKPIDLSMLITNIAFFFKTHGIIRKILTIEDRPKNQFLAYKALNIPLKSLENMLNRCRIFFSIRIYKNLSAIIVFLHR